LHIYGRIDLHKIESLSNTGRQKRVSRHRITNYSYFKRASEITLFRKKCPSNAATKLFHAWPNWWRKQQYVARIT